MNRCLKYQKHMRSVKSDGTLGNGYDPNKLIQCFTNGKWKHLLAV